MLKPDARQIVEAFLEDHGVLVRFDGSLHVQNQVTMAQDAAGLRDLLAAERPTPESILDQIVADPDSRHVTRNRVATALRVVLEERMRARKIELVEPLFLPLSAEEAALADSSWQRVARFFELDEVIVVAAFQHFIWSVKRKISRNPVFDQCMPIIHGQSQYSYHTYFVRHLLSPLEELIFQTSEFTDVAMRGGDIYRFPVLFLNDMAPIAHNKLPVLRRILTNDVARSRRYPFAIDNQLTTIGTTSYSPKILLLDLAPTDHVISMQFAAQADGVDARVKFSTDLMLINPKLLWRSVTPFSSDQDGFGPLTPLASKLKALRQKDASPPFVDWLEGLDLRSENISNATTPKGVSASALLNDYRSTVAEPVSEYRFARLMEQYADNSAMLFGGKTRCPEGVRYTIRKRASPETK